MYQGVREKQINSKCLVPFCGQKILHNNPQFFLYLSLYLGQCHNMAVELFQNIEHP